MKPMCVCVRMQNRDLLLKPKMSHRPISHCLVSFIVIVLTHVCFVFKALIYKIYIVCVRVCVCSYGKHFHHQFFSRLLFEPSTFIMFLLLNVFVIAQFSTKWMDFFPENIWIMQKMSLILKSISSNSLQFIRLILYVMLFLNCSCSILICILLNNKFVN